MEHCFFLLPLCLNLVLPKEFSAPLQILGERFPSWVIAFREMYWLLAPLAFLTIGNYNLDSKNGFCFFPGVPYCCRVVKTNIAKDGDDNSQKSNLAMVRRWAMAQNPPPNTSTHFWCRDMPPGEMAAFQAVANCYQISDMFRELFNEKHVSLKIRPILSDRTINISVCAVLHGGC